MSASVTLLGIDLGASRISVFLLQNGVKKKLSFGNQNFISSTLGFYNDKFIIGNDVQTMTPSSKLTVIANWKPFIGSSVVNNTDGNAVRMYTLKSSKGDKEISANDCLNHVLELLFDYIRSEYHVDNIDQVCIPTPVTFSDEKQRIVEETVRRLGVSSFVHLYEPIAAALSCSLTSSLVLIFDFGGSTFDAAVLQRLPDKDNYNVKEVVGEELGGNDITDYFCESQLNGQLREYKEILKKKKNYTKFHQTMERIKIILSDYEVYEVAPYDLGIRNCEEEVIVFTRKDLESAIMPIVNRVIECVSKVEDIKDVENVVLVGGSSQIPLVQTKLKELFHNDDLFRFADNTSAVAEGAINYVEMSYGRGTKVLYDNLLSSPLGICSGSDSFYPVISKGVSGASGTFQFRQLIPSKEVVIDVAQGHSKYFSRNRFIASFRGEANDAEDQVFTAKLIFRNNDVKLKLYDGRKKNLKVILVNGTGKATVRNSAEELGIEKEREREHAEEAIENENVIREELEKLSNICHDFPPALYYEFDQLYKEYYYHGETPEIVRLKIRDFWRKFDNW